MGVLPSSVLTGTNGEVSPAEGRPAEGRPAEGRGSRHDADMGVRAEYAADFRASAGNEAVTGVVRARVGLTEGMVVMV